MALANWTDAESQKAREFWREYERTHDLSRQSGRTAGVDPTTGRIRFGDSIQSIVEQMESEGALVPLYYIRIGSNHYFRKGGSR